MYNIKVRKLIFLVFPLYLLGATVFLCRVDAPIHPITEEYILRSLSRAEAYSSPLIIQLNTPGGLDTSMRKIMRRIMNSPVPVIVYVAPSGARAASAGFFIALSADFIAMAPGTNMGAAHPVAMGQKMDKVMSEKVAEDASALIRSLAQMRGRNVKAAEEAVLKSRSFNEKEALSLHLADAVAKNLDELLSLLDGKTLKKPDGREILLKTRGARVQEIKMNFREKFLTVLANPSLAYFLLMLGLLGLYFEFSHPGAVIPGVVGGISLILAFFAFQILPINIAGLLLIFLGIGLFIAEAKVQGFGLLGIGGGVSLFIGSLMLINTSDPAMKPSLSVISATVIGITVIVLFLIYLISRVIREKPMTGPEGMIGEEGEVFADFVDGKGKVFVHGELWNAVSTQDLKRGETVVVTGIKGMTLQVKRASD